MISLEEYVGELSASKHYKRHSSPFSPLIRFTMHMDEYGQSDIEHAFRIESGMVTAYRELSQSATQRAVEWRIRSPEGPLQFVYAIENRDGSEELMIGYAPLEEWVSYRVAKYQEGRFDWFWDHNTFDNPLGQGWGTGELEFEERKKKHDDFVQYVGMHEGSPVERISAPLELRTYEWMPRFLDRKDAALKSGSYRDWFGDLGMRFERFG